jgi:predicted phage terminase large subunit-like protein
MSEKIEIKPQPGRQTQFLASPADITIYGGAAGGGKTWALLMEPVRHIKNGEFGAVIFRRSYPEITREGGMWDESMRIYPLLGARGTKDDLRYTFPKGSHITFAHLQHDLTVYDWRGAQIPLLEFDQLETFMEQQFFYMLSRNRSTCGVKPYVRATANPEPGWLANFLAWWIAEDGYADLSRAGAMRWFVRVGETIHWADSPDELRAQFPDLSANQPQSVTFIPATIYDNPILMQRDPGYLGRLQALPFVDRERLLGDAKRGGNWKIKPTAGKVFNRGWFEIIDVLPAGPIRIVRGWDLAATEKELKKDDPDFTAGVKMAKIGDLYIVLDCKAEQMEPARTDTLLKNTASQDGCLVAVRWEMEGGASGKRDNRYIATLLAGYDARGARPYSDKITRAKPLAAQALAGNVKLLRGAWNEAWLEHMHNQPEWPHDDIMDASSIAFNELAIPVREAGSYQG